MILVDTSVWVTWSNVPESVAFQELSRLLALDEVATTDLVIAELLQGANTERQLTAWIDQLDAVHYLACSRQTWVEAARISFGLRRQGLTTALSDVAIASVALQNQIAVYATDTDFERIPGLRLHEPGTMPWTGRSN